MIDFISCIMSAHPKTGYFNSNAVNLSEHPPAVIADLIRNLVLSARLRLRVGARNDGGCCLSWQHWSGVGAKGIDLIETNMYMRANRFRPYCSVSSKTLHALCVLCVSVRRKMFFSQRHREHRGGKSFFPAVMF